MKRYLGTAAIGAAMVGAGVGLWSLPAGLVTAGIELLAGSYVGTYLVARAGQRKP